MLLYEDFREKIFTLLREKLTGLDQSDLSVDRTGHGDYTLKCFKISENGNYEALCENVNEILGKEDYIEAIECKGPYINFTIKPESMFNAVRESINTVEQYPDTFQDPERVVVEHTSTNPTGPIHIGRSRNSILGDSIARLFTRVGYRVTTQYFVNDSGRQVMAMLLGNRLFFKGKRDRESLLKGYQKIYTELEEKEELRDQLEEITRSYESGDEGVITEVREICLSMLQSIRDSLQNIGIKIDDYIFESGFLSGGDINEIMEALDEDLKIDETKSKSGENTSGHGDQENETMARYIEAPFGRRYYLQRSDGTSLYFLRDLAYHTFKALNADWVIDVLGEDHKDHGRGLAYVLNDLLEYRAKLDFVFYAFVSLESGKMSTRKGTIITLDDLVKKAVEEAAKIVREKRIDLPEEQMDSIADAIGKSSVRFNMVRMNPDKAMVFRWNEALSFEGDSAPFIIYSYARTSGILKRVKTSGDLNLSKFNKEERELVRAIYMYPLSLYNAWKSIRPDVIANYVLDLVKAFSDFYSKHSVINAPDEEKNKRLELIKLYRKTLEDSCKILGITLLEEM